MTSLLHSRRWRLAPLLLLSCALAAPRLASANPWTRDQGSFYVNLSYSTIGATSYYAPSGDKVAFGNAYRQHGLALYGEVGVIDRWLTAMVNADLYRYSSLEGQGAVDGFGDMRVGLRSGLLVHPLRLTLGLTVGLPTGDPHPQPEAGAAEGADLIAASLPTGDGEPDVELSLSAGKGFGGPGTVWPLRHYAIAEVGYWLRTRGREPAAPGVTDLDFADAINWRAELGINLPWPVVRRAWIIGRVFGSESLADEDQLLGFSGLGNGVSHRSYALELAVRLWRGLGLSVAANGAWYARGIAAGAQYKVALSWEQ